ncbi:PmoA family protein [Puniceicoccaceae bacterium K14]|nr:PmoA family protein [Puniceicoccaceae bacterium K14]
MKRILIVILFSFSLGNPSPAIELSVNESDDAITVYRDLKPILNYQKSVMDSPPGESDLFQRSGFIHPIYTPAGKIVTSIHPPESIHHMGMWHAWVHANFRDREIDFWNLKKGVGTVRYVSTSKIQRNKNTIEFSVRQNHVALQFAENQEEVILEELFTIRVFSDEYSNIFDYEIVQRNVTDVPLELPVHRYGGGIAYRAPENWGETQDAYLTSEGHDRTTGHTTRGRWCAMHGPVGDGIATVVIMCHPLNNDAPQRMRIRPKNRVFFNYVPTQENESSIQPGKCLSMKYRVLTFDDRPSVNTIEKYWKAFASE